MCFSSITWNPAFQNECATWSTDRNHDAVVNTFNILCWYRALWMRWWKIKMQLHTDDWNSEYVKIMYTEIMTTMCCPQLWVEREQGCNTESCRFILHNIRRVCLFLSQEAGQVLIQALVISHHDYCNMLLAAQPARATQPLQLIQNAAAWLVFPSPKSSNTTLILCTMHLLSVAAEIRFKTVVVANNATNGSGLFYIQDMVKASTPAHSLHSATAKRLATPSL